MEDRITDISDNIDRSNVNVKGLKISKKRAILIFIACLIVMSSVLFSLFVAKNKIENLTKHDDKQELSEELNNYQEGSKRTSVGENKSWLERARIKFHKKEELKNQTKPVPEETKKAPPEVTIQKKIERNEVSEPRPKPQPRYINNNHLVRADNTPPKPTQEEIDLARRLKGNLSVPGEENEQNVNHSDYNNSSDIEYDTSFDGSVFQPRYANVRKKNSRNFILSHGSSIPCALYTQIISEYSGFVTCYVTQDVYSSNGSVLLIERGSLVSGTQKISLEPGKNRVFTKWSDIETPDGIIVRIDSLGTGQLGATGNKVWVDNHYFERFSGAIMLSFVDDALATASNSISDDNVETGNSIDNVKNIAAKALENNLNISPTGYSKIGQRINILVVRDVNFSNVYSLE